MNIFSVRLLLVCAVLAGAFVQFGCTPKINPDERGLPKPATVPTAGEDDFELIGPGADGPGGAGQWGGLDKPMGGNPDGVKNEKRWEGVAVYFAYDKSTVGLSEQYKIEALAKHLLNNPGYYVIIEGYCDDRGSDEYNRALSERRALAVQSFLVSLGVAEDRIKTVGYGEEKPAVPGATTESEHAKNRRAEFILGVE